jgi:hypothetical protein
MELVNDVHPSVRMSVCNEIRDSRAACCSGNALKLAHIPVQSGYRLPVNPGTGGLPRNWP